MPARSARMRASQFVGLLPFLLSLKVSAQLPTNFLPFSPAIFTLESGQNGLSNPNSTLPRSNTSSPYPIPSEESTPQPLNRDLLNRATDPCQAGYNSCSTLNNVYSDVCCATSAVCSLDNNGAIACCPRGSFCTGTITPNTAPAATATASGSEPSTTGSVSYVANAFFSFPYLASNTLTNSAACASAVAVCSSEYKICTADLQGGSYGVTVNVAGGGGVTVAAPATVLNLGLASATSICSSLSYQACLGLQGTGCATLTAAATTGATATQTGFVVATAASGARGRDEDALGWSAWSWALVGAGMLGALIL